MLAAAERALGLSPASLEEEEEEEGEEVKEEEEEARARAAEGKEMLVASFGKPYIFMEQCSVKVL